MSQPLPEPEPHLLARLRLEKEDESLDVNIRIRNALAAYAILLPAAMNAAAAGNVTMRKAWREIQPFLPKRG